MSDTSCPYWLIAHKHGLQTQPIASLLRECKKQQWDGLLRQNRRTKNDCSWPTFFPSLCTWNCTIYFTCSEGQTARQLKIKRTTTAKRQDSTPEANWSFQNIDCKRQTITSPTERKSYLTQLSCPSGTRLPMKFSSQQSPPCQIFSGATSKRSMTNSFLAPGVSCAAVDTATQTRSCDSPTPQKGDKPIGWTTHAQKPTLLLLLLLLLYW